MKRIFPVLAVAAAAAGSAWFFLAPSPTRAATRFAPTFSPAFLAHWSDGDAELAGYRLTHPRYGTPRSGTAVAVFVKEPFSESARVKADDGRPDRDVFEAVKHHFSEDFQTGIYDYNVATSTFIGLEASGGRPVGAPAKVSFSAQEWCGHVYAQLLFDEGRVRSSAHSYFDGEADRLGTLEARPEGLVEDALWLWARGMTGPVLERGGSTTVSFLPSLKRSRLLHQDLAWTEATLSRREHSGPVTVPAGSFAVDRYTAAVKGGPTIELYVESAFPHRVVLVEGSDGYRAELTGATRLPYWRLNQPGDERYLAELGLPTTSR